MKSKFFAAVAALALSGMAFAQSAYPNRPLKMVIPFPAGGATDVLGRVLAAKLSTSLGQQVIVENRPGAGGTIGADAVAKAAPDGYTLLMSTSSTHSIGPAINPKIPYDAFKDFSPVSQMATVPNVLVVSATNPVGSAKQFAELLKANPGKYNYGSSGIGTIPHLSAELFKAQAGNVFAVHIPYRGTQLVIPDLVSGQVAFLMDSLVTAAPHVKDGKLKALAVTGSARASALPGVPTFDEAGIRGMDAATWFGVFVPANTPAPVLGKLNQEINQIVRSPEIVAQLAKLGADPVSGTPEQFARRVKSDFDQWSATIKRAGIKLEQ